jgi:hypothetical protein
VLLIDFYSLYFAWHRIGQYTRTSKNKNRRVNVLFTSMSQMERPIYPSSRWLIWGSRIHFTGHLPSWLVSFLLSFLGEEVEGSTVVSGNIYILAGKVS